MFPYNKKRRDSLRQDLPSFLSECYIVECTNFGAVLVLTLVVRASEPGGLAGYVTSGHLQATLLPVK